MTTLTPTQRDQVRAVGAAEGIDAAITACEAMLGPMCTGPQTGSAPDERKDSRPTATLLASAGYFVMQTDLGSM